MGVRTALVALILVSTTIALAAAPAAAQTFPLNPVESRLSMAIKPFDAPIEPLSGVAVAKVMLTYSHFAAPTLAPTQVNLKVTDAPSWVVAEVNPSTIQIQSGGICVPTCHASATANVLVRTLASAPAFTPGSIVISATALPNGLVAGSAADASFTVVADYFALTQVRAPDAVEVPRGGFVREHLTVMNGGNADTRLRFELVEAPEGVRVSLPNAVVLESTQRGGKVTQMELPFKIEASATSPGGRVTFLVNATYALDDTIRGDSLRVSFTVEPGNAADTGAAVLAAASFATAGPQAGTTFAFALVGAAAGLALAWRKVARR
ncbi:MAG TPA: hypothetical protein VM889_06580 [Candidatus Thermoplasmatota archaeon]|nr:hypothetical protein [Candidatus Thermoplasmatota archaeon]